MAASSIESVSCKVITSVVMISRTNMGLPLFLRAPLAQVACDEWHVASEQRKWRVASGMWRVKEEDFFFYMPHATFHMPLFFSCHMPLSRLHGSGGNLMSQKPL